MTHASATTIDSIKRSLVGLRMPRALEVLDTTRRIEQGEIDGIGALDQILIEELTLRENRRVKTALLMARLPAIKTLQGFDFAFSPRSIATASWRWPSSSSSTAPRWCIFSDRPARAKATLPRPWPSRP